MRPGEQKVHRYFGIKLNLTILAASEFHKFGLCLSADPGSDLQLWCTLYLAAVPAASLVPEGLHSLVQMALFAFMKAFGASISSLAVCRSCSSSRLKVGGQSCYKYIIKVLEYLCKTLNEDL